MVLVLSADAAAFLCCWKLSRTEKQEMARAGLPWDSFAGPVWDEKGAAQPSRLCRCLCCLGKRPETWVVEHSVLNVLVLCCGSSAEWRPTHAALCCVRAVEVENAAFVTSLL